MDRKKFCGRYNAENYNKKEKNIQFSRAGTIYVFGDGRKLDTKRDMQRSLMMRNRCLSALNGIICSKLASSEMNWDFTIIRPIKIFCSEVWTLRIAEQRLLGVWGRKCIRKIHKGRRVEDG